VKTAKKGGTEVFFGYRLNALVRVPGVRDTKDQEPRLVERFALTPAHLDIVDASLDVIDRIRERGTPLTELLSDRHYSYKTPERWADELAARSIRQVLDLHANDQGFRPYNGARLAAGWLHCPTTPDDLGTINHPGPGSDAQRKIVQEQYWGSDAWIASYKRRTYIEGVFGNIKNPDTENVRRGYRRVRGIARVSL
jgi:hypothetical protein